MKAVAKDQIKHYSDHVIHRSAGGFVFFEDTRTHELFIALLNKNDGKYVIPKGHVRFGETDEKAARREIREELSLKGDFETIACMGVNHYEFRLQENPDVRHHKDVYLYVFQTSGKNHLRPLTSEGFNVAEWLSFDVALARISFDRENLLKARRLFYQNKEVTLYRNIKDVPSITVAIPTYNGAKTIERTLYSVKKQLEELSDEIAKEIFICADHCTDGTEEVVDSFVVKNKNTQIDIKLITNQGLRGKTSALNTIFEQSKGMVFCVIDDDIVLKEMCLCRLIKRLVEDSRLRCAFSVWQRQPLESKSFRKVFWHRVLGVKFDIQPYDKPSEIMRGACMMLRRESFVCLPSVLVFNEDQFLQYIYWPRTEEVKGSIIYFNSVSSISDYCRRFIRIMVGYKNVARYIDQGRIKLCDSELFRKVDYRRIMKLPWRQKTPFLFYRFIRFFINLYVKTRIRFVKDYVWFRFN
jgi:glycosyltransferase involved in cell wall biosynthesis/8-oxo-dGTP pyrophosphatase MutT (NUDIX family)